MNTTIEWRLLLKTDPTTVFQFINSVQGRESFWAESALEADGFINFTFINGQEYQSQILVRNEPTEFRIEYFDTIVSMHFRPCEGGTELHLINTNVPEEEFADMYAGWVSVLMALKASVDYNIDLRNHDNQHSWDQKFVEN